MTYSRRAALAFAGGALALGAATTAQARERPRDVLAAFMRDKRAPGMQFAIVKDARLVASGASGLAHIESGAPVNAQTLFPINSATKPFTGVAVMQLQEAGLIDVAAPISTYLRDLPADWVGVTVAQCLSHCSGLPNIVDRNGLIGTADEAAAWALVRTRPVEFPPGARFSYNQTNYLLLGRLLTELARAPFTEVIAKGQFAPAGMARARFGDTFDVIANSAQPYSFMRRMRGDDEAIGQELSRWSDDMPASLRAGGGIYTTATELAAWLIALMDQRLLTKPASLAQMAKAPVYGDGREGIFALGWPVFTVAGRRTLTGIGGGRAAFCFWPETKSGVVILTNLVGANPENALGDVARAAGLA